MTLTPADIRQIIDALTGLLIALGVIFTAWQASKVKKTVDVIEKNVNGAASKAQDIINELRRELGREKEISAEKTQTAAVLQASTGQMPGRVSRATDPIKSEVFLPPAVKVLENIEEHTKETVETLKEIKEVSKEVIK